MLQQEREQRKVPGSLLEGRTPRTRKLRRLRSRLKGKSGRSLKILEVAIIISSLLVDHNIFVDLCVSTTLIFDLDLISRIGGTDISYPYSVVTSDNHSIRKRC